MISDQVLPQILMLQCFLSCLSYQFQAFTKALIYNIYGQEQSTLKYKFGITLTPLITDREDYYKTCF